MQKILQKSASLFLTAMLIISSVPTGFAAEASLRALDTTAGKPALIMVNGEPEQVVKLTITNPFKSEVSQQFKLDEEGTLQYWYSQALVAGEYKVQFEDQQTSFQVIPGLPDPSKSHFELSDYTAYQGKSIEGNMTLKDRYGNLLKGREVEVVVSGNATINCLNNCKTNNSGSLYFSVNSTQTGLKKLSVLEKEKNLKIFQEDIGFIPYVQNTQQNLVLPYVNQVQQPYNSYQNIYQQQPSSNFNYQGYVNPYQANFSAQGNDDALLTSEIESLLQANLLAQNSLPTTTSSSSAQQQASTSTVQTANNSVIAQSSGSVDALEIVFGNDEEADFEEEVSVSAQTALDLYVRAVDAGGNIVETYTGEVEFELSNDGLVPNDYQFSAIDKGIALFELALVLPAGDYTLTVQDKDNPNISGEVSIASEFQGTPSLNNTNVQLTIDSPIANSVYANEFSVQGSTNTENTEIVISEDGTEIRRVSVDENNRFNISLQLEDGEHDLDVTAIYLPDGSESTTTIPLEVDKTPPVITQVNIPTESVRAGEPFEVTAIAEERSEVQIFINNRSYDLQSDGGQNYSLTANAPLDEGVYPVHARATDELGNVTESPEVGTLTVVPGLEEIDNLFGVPGVESITLSWQAVEGAESYDVSYRSILGQGQQELNTAEPRIVVQNLSGNLSYLFTVTAKDAQGNDVSKPTESRAVKVLSAPVETVDDEPTEVVNLPEDQVNRPAADVQTEPARHTNSGPEVYLLVIASLVVLNLYGRARRALS